MTNPLDQQAWLNTFRELLHHYLPPLENTRSFSELNNRDVLGDGTIWGGAFWEMRTRLGRALVDGQLLAVWRSLLAQDLEPGNAYAFIVRLADMQDTPERRQVLMEPFVKRGARVEPPTAR